jgi:hypothetical protein
MIAPYFGFFRKFTLILWGGGALAFLAMGNAEANPFEKEPVNATFLTYGDRYCFTGDFTIDADPAVIWDVLTDYGHVQDYVADFHGDILRREGNRILVKQSLGEGFLFIRFDVHALLEIHEQLHEAIFAEDISHKEFTSFQSFWSLWTDPSGAGTKVTCMMDIVRNKQTPWYITPDNLRLGLRNFMKQYRYEIERREAKAKAVAKAVPGGEDQGNGTESINGASGFGAFGKTPEFTDGLVNTPTLNTLGSYLFSNYPFSVSNASLRPLKDNFKL